MRTRLLLSAAALLGAPLASAPFAHAQDAPDAAPPAADWHLADAPGISAARAYEMLAGRTPTPLVVAVIDSGVEKGWIPAFAGMTLGLEECISWRT